MLKLVGIRKNGNLVDKVYDNLDVATFEYECIKTVAKELTLYFNDIVLYKFKEKVESNIEYILEGKTVYGELKRVFKDKSEAQKYFRLHKDRCDWLTLYESNNKVLKQIDLHIHYA